MDGQQAFGATGAGPTPLLNAAGTGKRIYVTKICLTVDTDTTVTFKSGTTTIAGPFPIAARSGFISDAVDMRDGIRFALPPTNANEALNVQFGGSVTYGGWLEWTTGP